MAIDITRSFSLGIITCNNWIDANQTPSKVCIEVEFLRDTYSQFLKHLIDFDAELCAIYKSDVPDTDVNAHLATRKKLYDLLKSYRAFEPKCNDYFYDALVKEKKISCWTRFTSVFVTHDFFQLYLRECQ